MEHLYMLYTEHEGEEEPLIPELKGVYTILDVYDDEEDAIAAFGGLSEARWRTRELSLGIRRITKRLYDSMHSVGMI